MEDALAPDFSIGLDISLNSTIVSEDLKIIFNIVTLYKKIILLLRMLYKKILRRIWFP